MDQNPKENLPGPDSFTKEEAQTNSQTPEVSVEPEKETDSAEPETVVSLNPNQDQSQNLAGAQAQTYTPEELEAHVEEFTPLAEEEKLQKLKALARTQSLEKAIAILKKMNNPWLEDKFHDDLADDPDWRSQLEALGKIEKL